MNKPWCKNCRKSYESHVDEKCLFEASSYEPRPGLEFLKVESARFFHQPSCVNVPYPLDISALIK